MDRSTITDGIKTLIEKENDFSIEDNDQPLNIDSFTMMMVITYIDSNLGVRLQLSSLDFDNFYSLNTLADLVLDKINDK